MKKEENLFVTVTEECAELAKITSKILRFGIDNHPPGKDITNKEIFLEKYYHLQATVEVLQDLGVIPYLTEDKIHMIKNMYKWLWLR